jgi:hypothetical protein
MLILDFARGALGVAWRKIETWGAVAVVPLLFACQSAPEAVSAIKLQTLADAACICDRERADHGSYDPDNLLPCWKDFDAALKTTKWAYMSVAADGPASSAGICVGASDSDADSCVGGAQIWIDRPLGACSDTEAQDYKRRFDACLKAKPGDEIFCGNSLQKSAPLTRS